MQALGLAGLVLVAAMATRLQARYGAYGRPPVGVYGYDDVAVMLGVAAVGPLVVPHLPRVFTVIVAAIIAGGLLAVGLKAHRVGRTRFAVAALTVLLPVVIHEIGGPGILSVALADVITVSVAVVTSALWCQAGIRPRHLVAIAAALFLLDLVWTGWMPWMGEFLRYAQTLPLPPLLVMGTDAHGLTVGLGDLLFTLLTVAVIDASWGRRASAVSAGIFAAAFAAVVLCLDGGSGLPVIPAMVILAPVAVAQVILMSMILPRVPRRFVEARAPVRSPERKRP